MLAVLTLRSSVSPHAEAQQRLPRSEGWHSGCVLRAAAHIAAWQLDPARCRAALPCAARLSDADDVLELLWLLFMTVLAWVRPRQDLVLENLLLRHQLAVMVVPLGPGGGLCEKQWGLPLSDPSRRRG